MLPATVRPEEVTREAGVVFVTTPDRVISKLPAGLPKRGGFLPGQVVFQPARAHSADEVSAARSCEPWLRPHSCSPFANVDMAGKPSRILFCPGGRRRGTAWRANCQRPGWKEFSIDARDKALYHAAACIASNCLVSLIHFATEAATAVQPVPRREAFEALFPLIRGAIRNISQVGPAPALTGPVSGRTALPWQGTWKF